MKKNILKTIIIIAIIVVVIIGTMYIIDRNRIKNGENVIFSTWGAKVPALKINQDQNESDIAHKNYQQYTKTIERTTIELDIPEEWKFEELPRNDNYKYLLKIYKEGKEQYAMLSVYNDGDIFGVCGTGRTDEKITLDNGKKANVGYYDDLKGSWSDITFYEISEEIVITNCGLTSEASKEVLEFIKTINISEKE